MPRLSDRVERLLSAAAAELAGSPAATELLRLRDELGGPLRVAVAGWMKAGKSTLLNALLGAEVAATDAGECTRVTTVYRWAEEPSVRLVRVGGDVSDVPFTVDERGLAYELGAEPDEVNRLEIGWPHEGLQELCFIDTPGLESPTPGLSARARRAIAGELEGVGVDAVIYLVRHLHPSDVAFLEAFAASPRAEAGPVNAVAVLARADEIGGGRLDAHAAAERVAARYRADGRLRRLVQTVLPVNGLLAANAPTLTEADLEVLRTVSCLDASVRTVALASPELFVRHPALAEVPVAERADLVRRLAPFGLRLATEIVAVSPSMTAAGLSAMLSRQSGIEPLRRLLLERFAARAAALKARAALAGADRLARTIEGPEGRRLAAAVEEVVANAHELVELGELNRIRQHPPAMPEDLLAEAERLLGGIGPAPELRLGLPDGDAVRAAALAAADRWRALAEQPWPDITASRMARVVVRTCEGLVAATA